MAQAILASNTSVNVSYNDIAFAVSVPLLTFTTTTSNLYVNDGVGDTMFNDAPVDADQLVAPETDLADFGLTAGDALRAFVLLEITDGTNTFDLYIVGPSAGGFDASLPLNTSNYIFLSDPPVDTNTTYTFTGTYNNTADIAYSHFSIGGSLLICLATGTRIGTGRGERNVETLKAGDRIQTLDHGLQDLRLVIDRQLATEDLRTSPDLRPIRIRQGALGQGLPRRDLRVSPQHRMLISSPIAERMFGTRRTLVPAKKLTVLAGVDRDDSLEPVGFYHLVFDHHEIIFAESAPTESLLLGKEAMTSIPGDTIDALFQRFPDLSDPGHGRGPAALIPCGKRQERLLYRHLKNAQPVLSGYALSRPSRLPPNPSQ